jgi:DNA-binding GntR family transcriptional regulator
LVSEIYELRALLEPAAVSLAVPRMTPEDVRELRTVLDAAHAAENGSDRTALIKANRTFHQQLYAACPNGRLRRTVDELQDQVALISVVGWATRSSWTTETVEHEAIFSAVADGRADDAADLLRAHMTRFAAALHAALAGRSQAEAA